MLLHACCGPCSTSVLEYLTPHFDVTVFYYNPNIMPKEEFIRRENALKDVISHFDNVTLISPKQDVDEYLSVVKGREQDSEGGARCSLCFELRLSKTVEYFAAHRSDFDYFATTLTVSPHKNAQLINSIGNDVAQNTTFHISHPISKNVTVIYAQFNFARNGEYIDKIIVDAD